MSIHKPLKIVSGDLNKLLEKAGEFSEEWQGLSLASLSRFGVVIDSSGVYFPYTRYGGITGYKVRKHDAEHAARFYAIGDMSGVDLFGQYLCGGRDKLIVTEGEKDAISAYQMTTTLRSSISKLALMVDSSFDVVSIPTGATLKKDGTGTIDKGVKDAQSFLAQYSEIFLCLDQDEAGQAVANAIAQWLGPHVKIVRFSEKDANDMLKSGKEVEFISALKAAEAYRPPELLTPSDLRDEMLRPVDKGQPYPWPSMNHLLGGMRMGEVVTFAAGVKVGKTNAAMELTEHIVKNLGEKVGLFYLENTPTSTMQIVTGKMLGDMSAASRQRDWRQEEVDEAVDLLNDKVWIYNTKLGREWATIRPVMRWLAISEGVKYFFIDPLTALQPGDASAANAFLMDLMKDLTAMAIELKIHINLSSHLNPPSGSTSHEEGGRVQAIQLTGSRAMIRYSSAIVGIERNVIANEESIKNRSTVRVLLTREIGTQTGEFYCAYNPETGAFRESPHLKLEGTDNAV